MGKRVTPSWTTRFLRHLSALGFTNRMAIYLILLLVAGLAGGFVLAVLSIQHQYTGALACWTIVFTPIGTAVGIVIGKIVEKNQQENTGADGEGITFAAAKASNFSKTGSINSPEI